MALSTDGSWKASASQSRSGRGAWAAARTARSSAADATLAVLPPLESLVARSALLVVAIVLNAIATGMYIGAGFGPGPRDGLMTGLHARTGWSLRGIRTAIELSVLLIGCLLGGKFGVGTVIYALSIGPLIQLCLPWFSQPVNRNAVSPPREIVS